MREAGACGDQDGAYGLKGCYPMMTRGGKISQLNSEYGADEAGKQFWMTPASENPVRSSLGKTKLKPDDRDFTDLPAAAASWEQD